jgi:hypothetical protein
VHLGSTKVSVNEKDGVAGGTIKFLNETNSSNFRSMSESDVRH